MNLMLYIAGLNWDCSPVHCIPVHAF